MPFTLRLGRPDDADRCGTISYEAFKTIAEHHRFPPDSSAPDRTVANFARRLSHPGYHVIVAELDGHIVGSNVLDERSTIVGLGPITVDSAVQNRTIGRQLMQAALQRVAERQAPGVRLVQAADHTRSLSLYTTLGFEVREPLVTLQGPPLAVQIPSHAVRQATEEDLDGCSALCRRVHGHDRSGELLEAITDGTATVVEHEGVMYGDYVREIDARGTTVWEWHAQDDLDIERYPLNPLVHRDEFAHANACCPLPNGDIMLSFRRISTIMIIDRHTRKPRWEQRDDSWGMQHDCEMLANGHITLFANGHNTGQNPFSRVIELDPGTRQTVWAYQGNPPWTFFSPHISGAQRLASGHTLICERQWGHVFEVTPAGEIVWEYINPHHGEQRPGVFANWVFRAYRYAADSQEIRGRLGLLGA